jgi:hypothetical protein
MTELTLITQAEPPQSTEAEYLAAVAAMRLQHLIAAALIDYTKAHQESGLMVSAFITNELVRQVPGILEAVQVGGGR